MSFTAGRRLLASFESPSTSGRSDDARRVLGGRSLPRTVGSGIPPAARGFQIPGRSVVMCDSSRPPAGPSTVICSSLGKERKKLAKVLKSHRKVLEKRLSALTRTEVDAPVLSELLSELRVLTARLENQRAAELLQRMDDSDSSDSDDDECQTRSTAALCARRSATRHLESSLATTTSPACAAPGSSSVVVSEPSGTSAGNSTSMVVSTLTGEIELPVPAPQEGWVWDEEDFRAAKFEGAGGRVMVCTGSKCQRKGATEVLRAVSALADGNSNIEVVPCKCVGKCSAGAALRVRPLGQACATYTQVRPAQLAVVFSEHFAAPPSPICELGQQDPAAATPACCVECQQN
ncbi:hypothetical protein PLESTB_000078500 [Pleodorina starrii]|uniref:Uncharacterized protein n=1 Tax=Pleodorina starrii TaxID=330485 RepID=A0A9W6BAR4_9CHLO|nr:hypothetical protein PLESTM_000075000 [Pleodorina starrii]GLC48278.1 hypothetical protein PLESTB_000078500 [Pleodorina starrii]GLC66564.1 hypothetical protein PLESTF_000444400 [Pleodorina starrii]